MGMQVKIEEEPKAVLVTLEAGMTRENITEKIGTALGFDEETAHRFHNAYRAMQWDAFNDVLVPYLVETHNLTLEDKEVLLTHSTVYLDVPNDVLEPIYMSGAYQFTDDETVVEAAVKLIEPVVEDKETLVPELLDKERVSELLLYVRNETELLPDLVPLPPQDVDLRTENGRTLLVFTTVYYNQGNGNLELRADPTTIATLGDFDRNVSQRIYRDDGTYRERPSGSFHWHNEHLHYHFRDFVEYKLEALEGEVEIASGSLSEKSTFCIRDVSHINLPGRATSSPARYRICGRERQGVSVGWGDAYFNTYPDQNLDITDLPSGTYRLTFNVNPADRFDEITKNNNVASADIAYDKDDGTVEVLGTEPMELPEFEHIHIEQEF